MAENKLVQYGVYNLLETAEEKKGGRIISPNSKVILLEFYKNDMVLICRFGNYLDSMIVRSNILK